MNQNPGTLNCVPNADGSVTTWLPNGCFTSRYGGSAPWRENNPGRLAHPTDGSLGSDANGRAIFPDAIVGDNALRLAMNSAAGTTIAEKITSLGASNGWGDVSGILATMAQKGVDPAQTWTGWNGSYVNTNPNNMQSRDVIMYAIHDSTGYLANDSVGETTELKCPPSIGEIVSGSVPLESLYRIDEEDDVINSFGE